MIHLHCLSAAYLFGAGFRFAFFRLDCILISKQTQEILDKFDRLNHGSMGQIF